MSRRGVTRQLSWAAPPPGSKTGATPAVAWPGGLVQLSLLLRRRAAGLVLLLLVILVPLALPEVRRSEAVLRAALRPLPLRPRPAGLRRVWPGVHRPVVADVVASGVCLRQAGDGAGDGGGCWGGGGYEVFPGKKMIILYYYCYYYYLTFVLLLFCTYLGKIKKNLRSFRGTHCKKHIQENKRIT